MAKEKEKEFAVIGLGTFGQEVCRTLMQKGVRVIAIDNQPKNIERIKDDVTQAVLLDATDQTALAHAPIDSVDVAIVAIGDNIEASILATAVLRRSSIGHIISRAVNEVHGEILRQVGANEVVNIEIDQGRRIALRLVSPLILDNIPLSSDVSISELYAPRSMIGSSIREIDLRRKFNLNVISIKRETRDVDEAGNPVRREHLMFPTPDDRLVEGDILLVVGKNEDIDQIREY